MTDRIEIKLHGFDELRKKLKKLPESVQSKYLSQAVSAGAQVVVKDARKRAPVDTGNLRRAITKKKKRTLSKFEAVYAVLVKKKNIGQRKKSGRKIIGPHIYWRFAEFGIGKWRDRGAHPFMRPAFENNKQQIIDAMGKKLMTRIEQEAKK